MRKFTLFLMSLFLTMGAMAQAELDGCYVTFTNVQKNGTKYSLYVNSNKQLVIASGAAPTNDDFYKFYCEKQSNGKYTFYNENAGVYMIWRNGGNDGGYDGGDGTMATYNSTYCDWSLNASTNCPGGYYITSKRKNGTTDGTLIILNNGVFDAWTSGEGWADGYSNVFMIEKVVEPNKTFTWTTSTSWTDVNTADYTSTIFNDNALGYGIKYIDTEITVGGARTATVTFRYTSGSCALNIRAVEVLTQSGTAVAGDYHVGKAGGSHENNVYTVSVAEAGTYTVRLYATFGANDRANATNGNVTVAFAAADAATFSHDVTFAAEYATLYLGYKVAIPEGVEAYVVSSTENGYAQMQQVQGVLPANTGVLLKNVGGVGTYTFSYSDAVAATVETNLLNGSITNRYVSADAYVLGVKVNTLGLYLAEKNKLGNEAWLNNANKAYLQVPEAEEGEEQVASYSFRFGEGTTAIENVEVENEVKVIYDLTGRRVEAITAPGIYIVGGKKVLVK